MDPSPLDLVRASREGRLTPREEGELAARLAADPELAALARDYELVHELTGDLPEPPPCGVRFADLEVRLAAGEPPWRPRRRVAATLLVGGLAAAALGTLVLHGRRPAARPVLLRSLSLAGPVGPRSARTSMPAELATFRPVVDGSIRWFEDLDRARETARWSGRPLLVFGTFPGCPKCLEVRQVTLRDQGVLQVLDGVVPVEVDVSRGMPAPGAPPVGRPFPYLELQEPDGTALVEVEGIPEPDQLELCLGLELESRSAPFPPPTWKELQRTAERHSEALLAEAAGEDGRAFGLLQELARSEVAAFREDALDGLERIAGRARQALRAARELAGTDPDAARAGLERAARSLAGCGYGEDLLRVAEELARTGEFPELRFAAGSSARL